MPDSRYNRLDNQSPVQTALKADSVSVGRSAFDFSCIHNTNAIMGALVPVDCFDVVPNEDIDLSLSSLLEFRNPTTRQLFNGMRVFFHAYYNRLTDLWEGAQNWIDNGRSGKTNLSRPNLIYRVNITDASLNNSFCYNVNACTPMSLLNYLGLPAEVIPSTVPQNDNGSTFSTFEKVPPLRYFQTAIKWNSTSGNIPVPVSQPNNYFPADCAFAYQRNWRDFYSNKNLLQLNKHWFPENEDHFILSYSCTNALCIDYENELPASSNGLAHAEILTGAYPATSGTTFKNFTKKLNVRTPEPNSPTTDPNILKQTGFLSSPSLSGLKFRQFRGDRFTTALPFPDLIRGDIPVLEINNKSLQGVFDVEYTNRNSGSRVYPANNNAGGGYSDNNMTVNKITTSTLVDSKVNIDLDISQLGITMSDIYTLETLTAFRRRMGMTNGDYNEMIKAQYGVNPNVHDRKGTYIGGFYQDFAFNSVTQTSESSDTPLGTKAGQGVSSGSGSIGHFHTPDFGWIQIYMSIVPDVYYTQGIPKMFSKKNNLEMYFPIFNNLPAQAILNKEIWNSGIEDIDNMPFAYEDRYAEYKSRHSRVSGLMALPVDKAPYDTARIIARRFESLPSLNSLFVTMVPENVDMSVFSVSDEPPFDVSVGISCRRVFPGPYTAIEGGLSSPALVRG